MADAARRATKARIPSRFRGLIDAEDLRQEAMLRVYRSEADFAQRTPAERLCYERRSFASALGDSLRYFGRARRHAPRAAVGVDELSAGWTSPSGRAARNEQLVRLTEALRVLPDDQRTAITLHHLEGLSLTDTAAAMGRSFDSVAGLLRRGLKDLRRRLVEP